MIKSKICEVNSCGKPSIARRWCEKHYRRWKKHGDPLGGGRHYKTPDESFKARTKRNTEPSCIEWTGTRSSSGYGEIHVNGKAVKAHRFAWERVNGPIPDGLHVLHHCDNPPCVNVDHLFLGTNQDNIDDKCFKGRQSCLKGSMAHNAKLTEADIPVIRADTRLQRIIAADYDVNPSAISKIKNRTSWRHVNDQQRY